MAAISKSSRLSRPHIRSASWISAACISMTGCLLLCACAARPTHPAAVARTGRLRRTVLHRSTINSRPALGPSGRRCRRVGPRTSARREWSSSQDRPGDLGPRRTWPSDRSIRQPCSRADRRPPSWQIAAVCRKLAGSAAEYTFGRRPHVSARWLSGHVVSSARQVSFCLHRRSQASNLLAPGSQSLARSLRPSSADHSDVALRGPFGADAMIGTGPPRASINDVN